MITIALSFRLCFLFLEHAPLVYRFIELLKYKWPLKTLQTIQSPEYYPSYCTTSQQLHDQKKSIFAALIFGKSGR
jgi:hypothetical protein